MLSVKRMAVMAAAIFFSFGLAAPALALCGFNKGDPEAGEKIYKQTCIACHGANGHGNLQGTPNFTKKGGVLSKPHEVLTKHITNGFRSSRSQIPMPPKGSNPRLTTKDIEDVHAYLHKKFGCGR